MSLLKLTRKQEIDLYEILYLESDINYTKIFTLEAVHSITSAKTLGTIQQQLDRELFFRINRGQVINLNHVSNYTKKGSLVIAEMINGHQFVFSRRRSKDFEKRQGEFYNLK